MYISHFQIKKKLIRFKSKWVVCFVSSFQIFWLHYIKKNKNSRFKPTPVFCVKKMQTHFVFTQKIGFRQSLNRSIFYLKRNQISRFNRFAFLKKWKVGAFHTKTNKNLKKSFFLTRIVSIKKIKLYFISKIVFRVSFLQEKKIIIIYIFFLIH